MNLLVVTSQPHAAETDRVNEFGAEVQSDRPIKLRIGTCKQNGD